MQALHFGDPQRLLFGYHHAATSPVRQTAVLICHSWGLEYMRSYRGLRVLAQRFAAAGYETLRFDYSGTGDSQGHGLDARLEHWLADIATAARELRDISGRQEVAVVGLRLGALLAQAAPGVDARLHVSWDTPASGASFVSLMRHLATSSDAAKQWRRNRDMRLPPAGPNELYGHAWPTPLAEAIEALPGLPATLPRLCYISNDHPAPPGVPESAVLGSGEPSHWHDVGWIHTPWVPATAAVRLVEHLAKTLP